MNKLLWAALAILAISHYQNYLFNMEEAATRKDAVASRAYGTNSSASYDVQGLNDLVARVSLTRKQKQADTLAEVWHITQADLESNIDIFGEKRP